jgi:type IV pilus assembly protein PilC
MPRYHYEVIDADGSLRHGEVEEESPERLADSLQKKGLIVVSVSRFGDVSGGKSGLAAMFEEWNKKFILGNGKVKLPVLLHFTTQLASMVGAGLHLLRTLTSLATDASDKRFKIMLENIKSDVEGGEAFSSALAKYPNTFTDIYVNLVKAAEATGEMDVILNQLSVYLEKTMTLRRKVKGAMTYPLVILSFALIAILVLVIKIVPVFEQTFAKLGARLPAPTQILITISNTIRNYFFFTACLVGGVVFLLWRFFNTQRGRYIWDKLIIKIPVFGPLIWKSVVTRFLRTLSILLRSGVSVLEAFRLAGKASAHKVLEKCAYQCMDEIRDGRPIGEAMARTKVFPEIVLRMVSTGEEAGTLPEMLEKVTNYFEQQVEATVDALSSLIEPILIVFLGTIVGAIIVAIFMPIFRLGEAVKGLK